MLKNVLPVLVVTALVAAAYGQQPATPAPAPATPAQPVKLLPKQPYTLGPAVIHEYPAAPYLFVTEQATQKTMPEVMKKLIPHLLESAKQAGVTTSGPIVLVYHGMTADPTAKFEVEAGLIVTPATKATADAEVRQLEPFKCAAMVYTGQPALVGKAYEALIPAMMAGGSMPNMEMRQMVLYYETDDSPNNMMLIQMGIQ